MRLLRLVICEEYGWLTWQFEQGRAGGPLRLRPCCLTAPWLLCSEGSGPSAPGLVPLTYFGRPALETWADTRSRSGAGHLPAGLRQDAWRGRGEGGEPRGAPDSGGSRPSRSLLLTARRGLVGAGKALPRLPARTAGRPRKPRAAGGGEEAGSGGRPPSPCPPLPSSTNLVCHARGSPCIAHHEPGPGWTLATHNLASISTLARMFMI